MSGLVEEIGARLVIAGKREFLASIAEAEKATKSLGKTTVSTNTEIVASNRAAAEASQLAASKMAESAALRKAAAEKSVEAARLQAIGETKAAKATNAEATALRRSAVAAREESIAARASATAADMQATAHRRSAAAAEGAAASTALHTRALSGLAKIGKVALFGAAATATIVGVASVRAAGNFQQAMTMVHTMAGVSSSRIAALSDGLLNMAPSVAAGPNALADALYRIASASAGMGSTNAQLLAMTKAAAQLNLIGGGTDASLGETSRVLGGVRASDIKGAGGYKNIVALAAATVGSGDMKMPDFINALGTGVLPAAKNYGVTLPDVGALLSVLTDNLIPGSTAGHVMAHMFALMGSPSGVGTKGFNAIGLHATDLNYTMRDKGLIPALQELKAHLGAPQSGSAIGGAKAEATQLAKFGFTDSQIAHIMSKGADSAQQATLLTRMFGGAKQSVPIITALSELSRLEKRQRQIAKQTTPANAAAAVDAATNTFNNKVKALEASLQVLEVRIGNKLIPILERWASWLSKHKSLVETVATAIGTFLVVAVMAYTVAMTQAAIATIAATWPVLAIIAAVALLAVGFTLAWQKSQTFRTVVTTAFQLAALGILGIIQGLLKGIHGFASVSDFIFGTHFGRAIDKAETAVNNLMNKIAHLQDKTVTITVAVRAPLNPALHKAGFIGPTIAEGLAAQGVTGPYTPLQRGISSANKRAGGGVVHAGTPYWVGERGPELFVPIASGSIRPTGSDGFSMPVANLGRDSAAGGAAPRTIVVEKGAVVVYESGDPRKTYEAARQGLADAMARK
jgi:TP901 family phage tail tape measure protein